MPDYLENVKQSVALGLSICCATCVKWHRAKEQGLDKCLAEGRCGSPIVSDTFSEYEGPITDFLRFCFVCGAPATKALRVQGHERRIGVCNTHAEYVVTHMPKLETPRFQLPVLPPEGYVTVLTHEGESRIGSLVSAPSRTLSSMLAQVEAGTFKPDNC